ncbi:MAG: DUF86 domain-containing protein [SAR324 cluster bacterium]|nr:DUF86 domain-containing protein [SAR324 cluster bacterium]
MKDKFIYLFDILDSIERINKYVKGSNYHEFESDDKTQDAVIRQITIIGEASNKIDEELKHQISSIPWHKVIAMRHRMVHDYAGIVLEVVWQTIHEDLATLQNAIQAFINNQKTE